MFLFKKIKELEEDLALSVRANLARAQEFKNNIIDLKESVDLLKLNSCCLSDMKVIFKDLAQNEIREINASIGHEYSLTYEEVRDKRGTGMKHHIFYLSRRGDKLEIYSDLELMTKYEFSDHAIKSEVVRKAFVLYLATKKLKEKLPLIEDLINIKCNIDYINVENKKMKILEGIGK